MPRADESNNKNQAGNQMTYKHSRSRPNGRILRRVVAQQIIQARPLLKGHWKLHPAKARDSLHLQSQNHNARSLIRQTAIAKITMICFQWARAVLTWPSILLSTSILMRCSNQVILLVCCTQNYPSRNIWEREGGRTTKKSLIIWRALKNIRWNNGVSWTKGGNE